MKIEKITKAEFDAEAASRDPQELMHKAVKVLMQQYGWDEGIAASVVLTVTTAIGLAPKKTT